MIQSYELITLGNEPKSQNTILFDVPIHDRVRDKHIIKAYAIDEICYGDENVNIFDVVRTFKNLSVKDI